MVMIPTAERNTSELLNRIAEDIENTNSKDELLKCIEDDRSRRSYHRYDKYSVMYLLLII